MMTKIYVVRFDNNGNGGSYVDFNFKYCYKTKQEAQQAIEELLQDKDFITENSIYREDKPLTSDCFWIEELELV